MNEVSLATRSILLIAALIGIYNYFYWKRVGKAKNTLGIQMPRIVCVLSAVGVWLVVFSGILAISILI